MRQTTRQISAAAIACCALAAPAASYPIDCAILLCMGGGWPANAHCTAARAEVLRRITPWPVEPPLQIWRCPMGASHQVDRERATDQRVTEVGNSSPLPVETAGPVLSVRYDEGVMDVAYGAFAPVEPSQPNHVLPTRSADIDLSDLAFDFVRSIRVFQIDYEQRWSEGSEQCNVSDRTRLGTYGPHGAFAWRSAPARSVPAASGFDVPSDCNDNTYRYRSVFLDWTDYAGSYGSEEVRY